MKKIYSKLTKERARKYQIETSIYIDEDGKKTVQKKALNKDAYSHVDGMFSYYEKKQSSAVLVPVEKICDGCVAFTFASGQSLYEYMIKALERKQVDVFWDFMGNYKEILDLLYEHQRYQDTYQDVNVDLTFDNIILTSGDNIQIIDYEWVFSDVFSLGFSIYRAIYAFYTKNSQLCRDIVSFDELIQFFDLAEQVELYKMQVEQFDQLIFGEISYGDIIDNYKKDNFYLDNVINKSDFFTQVYFDSGNGFSEMESKRYPFKKNNLYLEINRDMNIKRIRIDLNNFPFIAKGIKIYYYKENIKIEIKEYEHNSVVLENGNRWFWHDDPQIIIDFDNEKLKSCEEIFVEVEEVDGINLNSSVEFSYMIGQDFAESQRSNRSFQESLDDHKKVLREYKQMVMKNENDIKNLSMELVEKDKELEQRNKELEQKDKDLAQKNHELDLIHESRLYNALLKRKIDNIINKGW